MAERWFGMLHRLQWWCADRGWWRISDALLNHMCPYPIEGRYTIRACNEAGCCGCNNGWRPLPSPPTGSGG